MTEQAYHVTCDCTPHAIHTTASLQLAISLTQLMRSEISEHHGHESWVSAVPSVPPGTGGAFRDGGQPVEPDGVVLINLPAMFDGCKRRLL